jgi:hypothetical protein
MWLRAALRRSWRGSSGRQTLASGCPLIRSRCRSAAGRRQSQRAYVHRSRFGRPRVVPHSSRPRVHRIRKPFPGEFETHPHAPPITWSLASQVAGEYSRLPLHGLIRGRGRCPADHLRHAVIVGATNPRHVVETKTNLVGSVDMQPGWSPARVTGWSLSPLVPRRRP